MMHFHGFGKSVAKFLDATNTRYLRSLVLLMMLVYFFIFSFLSIRRIHALWASYYDLGIMNQTVHNSYIGIRNLDLSRLLELTDPHESGKQIKRMAIHNDVLLAIIAPLYYLHDGPETLLVLQSGVLASGALALFLIFQHKIRNGDKATSRVLKLLSVTIPYMYLIYSPLQRTNLYEFHAVTLSTGLILWMYLSYLQKKWKIFCLLFLAILLSKEQAGFSLGIFLLVELVVYVRAHWSAITTKGTSLVNIIRTLLRAPFTRSLFIFSALSILYVIISVFVWMPVFRSGNDHFALEYFKTDELQSGGLLLQYVSRIFYPQTLSYILFIFGPTLFLSLFSPLAIPLLPDLLVNLVSRSANMQSVYFHYTALITPWVFIGLIDALIRIVNSNCKRIYVYVILCAMCISSVVYSTYESPLPYSKTGQPELWTMSIPEQKDILLWQQILKDDAIIVSSTGQFAPYLTSRRVFYNFGQHYVKADYVLIRKTEVFSYGEKDILIPQYNKLITDPNFKQIYSRGDVEVYKKL